MMAKARAAQQTALFADDKPAQVAQEAVNHPPPARRRQRKARTTSTAVATVAPKPQHTTLLGVILEAASNPQVDVPKMRELLTMQQEIEREQARKNFTRDLIALQSEMPSIGRDGRINEGITRSGKQGKNTRFASFENLNKVCGPIFRKHGFALWFEPDLGVGEKVIVRGHMDHVDGHGTSCVIPLKIDVSGNKNEQQGAGSSISYGKRYAMIAMANIQTHAPQDRDTDGGVIDVTASEVVSEKQLANLIEACEDKGAPRTKLVDYLNANRPTGYDEIKQLKELPAARYQEAMAVIGTYKRKGEA